MILVISEKKKEFAIAKKGQIYTFQKSSNLNNYLNMAWLVGVRKSKIRLSSLVSWLTLMLSPSSDSSSAVTLRLASSICNGNWGSEAETTQICLTWSSTSFCVQPSTFSGDFLTSAWTSTMLSLEILQKNDNFSLFWIIYWSLANESLFFLQWWGYCDKFRHHRSACKYFSRIKNRSRSRLEAAAFNGITTVFRKWSFQN